VDGRPGRRGGAQGGARLGLARLAAESGRARPEDLGERRMAVLRDVGVAAGVEEGAEACTGCCCCGGLDRLFDARCLRVALRGHDDDERSVFAASEGLQRALVGLVGRVAGDRERLEPALRNLGGRERAEDRESEPRADHEQAVADDLAGE